MSSENARYGGDWQDLVVICSGTHWDRWYPSEKHIALRLCARTPVLYVDPPSSPIARGRGAERPTGLRILQPRLAVLSPRGLPAQSRPVMRSATSFLTRKAIARAVRALGAKHVRALIVANHTCLFQAVQARHRVMFATDDFVAGAGLMGLGRDYLLAEERKQANEADHVIVVTEKLGEHWRALGQKPILIPNGCDTERFADTDMAPWPEDVDLPRPIAGVFGHFSERIDLRLLQAVADRGHSLLLVGTLRSSFSLENLLTRRNVRYVGPKPFEAMPSYLRSIDVGLTPYADIEFNRASFPLKTLEYLAAGRPAVSTDLPAARWLDTDLVRVARDPRAFADAVDSLMSQPRTVELARKCQAFARRHSWLARTEAFAGILGLPEPAANAA
jgi:teichuronic acid biosynthesis glycosyltransferase TuaH